jgi:hypothetical protein
MFFTLTTIAMEYNQSWIIGVNKTAASGRVTQKGFTVPAFLLRHC